jgi:hypothetical protein
MGKIIFRKIRGRIVPVALKEGNVSRILKGQVSEAIQDVRAYRKMMRDPKVTLTKHGAKIVHENMKTQSSFAAYVLNQMVKKIRGKK